MTPKLHVLGRSSFVGSELIEAAAENGIEVSAWGRSDCDLLNTEAAREKFTELSSSDPITLVVCSVVNKSVENSFDSYLNNLKMAQNIAAALPSCVKHVIGLSSVDVYGDRPPASLTETSPIAPDTWYGLAKYSAEWIFQHEMKVPVTILRIPGIFGPSPFDRSVIGKMFTAAKDRQVVTVTGDGASLRDFVYVRDLGKIIIELAKHPVSGVLNIATGEPRPVKFFAEQIAKLSPPSKVEYTRSDSERDFSLSFDIAKFRSILPDFRFTPIEAALARYQTLGR